MVGADAGASASVLARHRAADRAAAAASPRSRVADAAAAGRDPLRRRRGATCALPVAEFIDLAAERARLTKEIAALAADIDRTAKKLDNADFVARAPEEVVEENRERLAEAEAAKAKLEARAGAAGDARVNAGSIQTVIPRWSGEAAECGGPMSAYVRRRSWAVEPPVGTHISRRPWVARTSRAMTDGRAMTVGAGATNAQALAVKHPP